MNFLPFQQRGTDGFHAVAIPFAFDNGGKAHRHRADKLVKNHSLSALFMSKNMNPFLSTHYPVYPQRLSIIRLTDLSQPSPLIPHTLLKILLHKLQPAL